MDQDKKEQFVDTLLDFVNKNKNKTIRAVFQAEKIGARLDKDIGDVLVKAIYGRIGRTSLRRTLENIYDRNSTRYERNSRFMDNLKHLALERLPLIERDKDGVVETRQNYSTPRRKPIEIQPPSRLKTGPEKKPNVVKEFTKNVLEGLGPRIPSLSGMLEIIPHIVYAFKGIKYENEEGYREWVEAYGYGEENPYYDNVSPEFRENVKNGLVK